MIAPNISVIIPTKNRKALLRAVLHSVQKQTVKCEVFVMDDGSTDGTEAMVRSEFPEATVLHEEASKGPNIPEEQGCTSLQCILVNIG